MHNNTNFTYFSHFWSNIKTNKLIKTTYPYVVQPKNSANTGSTAFPPQRRHDTRETLKIFRILTQQTELQHCLSLQTTAIIKLATISTTEAKQKHVPLSRQTDTAKWPHAIMWPHL